MSRVLAIAALLCALAGCGTVKNFTDGHNGQTKPYGGVKIAAKEYDWSEPIALAILWPIWTGDVALSAVGDTLTLPIPIPNEIAHTVNQAIRDYYFPKNDPPPNQ